MDNRSDHHHSEFTPRESHIMGLVTSGMKNGEVAEACASPKRQSKTT